MRDSIIPTFQTLLAEILLWVDSLSDIQVSMSNVNVKK